MSMARKLRKKQQEKSSKQKEISPLEMGIIDGMKLFEAITGETVEQQKNDMKINISDEFEYITANEVRGLIQLLEKHPKQEGDIVFWIADLKNLVKEKDKLIKFITEYTKVQELYEFLEKLLNEAEFSHEDMTKIFTDFDYSGCGLHGQLAYINNFVGFRLEEETEPVYLSRRQDGIQFDEVINLIDCYRNDWNENAKAILGNYMRKAEKILLEVVYQNEDEEDFEAEEHEYYEYLEEIQSL